MIRSTIPLPKLGVNIDHIATFRQMRQTPYPNLLEMARLVVAAGADQITVHLREDRRHIQPQDVRDLKSQIKIPLNLESAVTDEAIRFAKKIRPDWMCLVPEKRQEVTTEGGLNFSSKGYRLKVRKAIEALHKYQIKVSLFVEPSADSIKYSSELGADAVELHTGLYCRQYQGEKKYQKELKRIEAAGLMALDLGLRVHAGHGICDRSVRPLVALKDRDGLPLITEYNIGHYIIARSLTVGISQAVKEMQSEIHNP